MRAFRQFAWQKGDFGIYAAIDLSVVMSTRSTGYSVCCKVNMDTDLSDAIRFGVGLFCSAYAFDYPDVANIDVTIESADLVPCDSTPCVVSYVTFHAICEAFSIEGESVFSFDESTGRFIVGTNCNN